MLHQPVISDVRKIAVLRANALGDYLFTLPALEALKQTYPDAELVYLGNAWHETWLAGRPGPVDRVIVVPRCKGIPEERDHIEDAVAVDAFFDSMRAESFDIALQMHGGGGNSNPFVRALGARVSAGLCADGAPPLDINIPYVLYQNEILRYLEVAGAVGAAPVTVEPRLVVTDRDMKELHAQLTKVRAPYVVLHPGASDIRRRWPAKKMAALADAFIERDMEVCITGVAAEAEDVAAIIGRCRHRPHDLCGKLSLNAMTALLAGAELVVSNDTGPLHLARAVGTRTIGIYWIGNVINAGPPVAQGHRYCMSWTLNCPSCGMDCVRHDAHVPRNGCSHSESFVDAITLEEVWRHADALLGATVATQRSAMQ